MDLENRLLDSSRLMIALCAACLAFASSAAAEPPPQDVGGCASVVASARFIGDGYRHIVTLTNSCQRPVSCEVWTNVDPSPHYTLQANPGKTADVIVRNSSPATGVQAGKICKFTR